MNRQYGALSGIAILLIVLNHSIHFGLQVAPPNGRWLVPLVMLQALGAFAVPAFLFISGAFLAYASSALTPTFVFNSLKRILSPYLVWSVVFYIAVFVTSGVHESAIQYVRHLLVGYPYHFVPLLAFWYVTSPLLAPAARRYPRAVLVAVGSYQVFLLFLRDPMMFGMPVDAAARLAALAPPVLFTSMADWAIYFPLGFVFSSNGAPVKTAIGRWKGSLVGLTIVLFAMGLLDAFGLVWAPWGRHLAPLPLVCTLPIIRRPPLSIWRLFESLGRQSYALYLVHFIVIILVVQMLGASMTGVASAAVYPLLFAVAVGTSLLVIRGIGMAPQARRFARYILG